MHGTSSKRKIIIGALIALLLIAAFGGVMHFIEKHGEQDEQYGDTGDWGQDESETGSEFTLDFPNTTYVCKDDVTTYLLIGTDAGGEDMGKGFNGELADFLSLLVLDNTTNKYAFIQIDRNTMANVTVYDENGEEKGDAYEQICIAHWYGLDAKQRNENTVKAVSELLGGFPIDGYYTLHMDDIALVNNAIGGVTVEIQEDLTNIDPAFVAGTSVHLEDEQAEKFVRARMNAGEGTNKERMSRQRQYMTSAYQMMITQLRESPEYVNDLYDQLNGIIESNGNDRNIGNVANQLVQLDSVGILDIEGKTQVNDTQKDGKEHEEFYTTEDDIVAALKQVINLSIPE